jgi:uncharacterized phage infection (PIP) family protein YhgE
LDFSSKEQDLKQLLEQVRNQAKQEEKQRYKMEQLLNEKQVEFDKYKQKCEYEQGELKSEVSELKEKLKWFRKN